jgi:hypothetical protein
VLALGVVVLAVLAALAGASFMPRWWAQRVGDQVDGSIGLGIVVGLVYGVLFTALPLLVVWLALRLPRTLRVWAAALGVAVILAVPNLLTLGIVLGSGSGAHAGERILDVEAPGFRGATLIGALLVLALAGLLTHQRVSGRRLRRRAKTLRRELESRPQSTSLPAEPERATSPNAVPTERV